MAFTGVLDDVGLRVGHDHVLTAEDVGRTHQNRQADLVGCGQSLFQIEDSAAGCAGDVAALQQLIEALTVFGLVDGIRRGAEDGQTDLVHMLCKLDGSLTAELDDAGVGLLGRDDVIHALGVQRPLSEEAVSGAFSQAFLETTPSANAFSFASYIL